MIRLKVIRPGPKTGEENQIKKENKGEEKDLLRAGLIIRRPDLFDSPRRSLDQIHSIINTYISRKDYQVTKGGLNAIYSITFKYIDVRNGTFFPSSMIQDYDHSSDSFLNDAFEKLLALHRQASKDKDLELSKEIIECLTNIATKCTTIRYTARGESEYTHCMLALAYMQQCVEDSLNADLLDVGIQGSESLRNIGLVLIAKDASVDVRTILEELSKIALYGLAKPNASFLISYPFKAYSLFVRAALFSENVDDLFLLRHILEKVETIIDLYVKVKEPQMSSLSVDMGYSIGDFVDLSKQVAMPYLFAEVYNKIIDEKTDERHKKKLARKISQFAHDLWQFYDNLSKSTAPKESFLIFYIDSNIEYIASALLNFYELGILEYDQQELLDDVGWLISDYWRLYKYHTVISASYQWSILDHLLKIGDRCNRLKLWSQLNDVIDIIVYIAESFLEKEKDSSGFEPSRILRRATYLCILSDSEEVKTAFIEKIKDRFWKNYVGKFPHHRNLLFKELAQIDPGQLR